MPSAPWPDHPQALSRASAPRLVADVRRESLMDEESLARIEKELSTSLPGTYRALLIVYPFAHLSAGEEMVVNDPDWLITRNLDRQRRKVGKHRGTRPPPTIADGLLLIGTNGSEREYFVSLKSDSDAILEYDHETGALSPFAGSVAEYVRKIQEIDREVELDETPEAVGRDLPAWRQKLSFYAPAVVGLFIVFVVVPVMAFGIRTVVKWLLG